MQETLKEQLAKCIHVGTVRRMCGLARMDSAMKEQLYELMFCDEQRVADNAAWVLVQLEPTELLWLEGRLGVLADAAMRTSSDRLCRLLLTLLERLSGSFELYPEFLDFCLSHIPRNQTPAGIRSLCIRLACDQSLYYPELLEELRGLLELMEPDSLPPSVRSMKKRVLQDISLALPGDRRS